MSGSTSGIIKATDPADIEVTALFRSLTLSLFDCTDSIVAA